MILTQNPLNATATLSMTYIEAQSLIKSLKLHLAMLGRLPDNVPFPVDSLTGTDVLALMGLFDKLY